MTPRHSDSPAVAGVLRILRRLRWHSECPATGKLRLTNPDGPSAADEITALRAEIAELKADNLKLTTRDIGWRMEMDELKASIADERKDAAREMREACAKVADRLGGVRGPHDAVSPSNRAQHTRARTIAAAIRAGVGEGA